MWIKNTDGKPDAMLTFAVIAFALVILNLFLATFGVFTLAGVTLTFTAMSASTITALLGPTLVAYVGRRYTGAAFPLHLGPTSAETVKELPDENIETLPELHPTGERL